MLRLNKNRKRPTKGKHSDPTKTMEKVPSKQYEENYNEVILNDLVPEEKRSELGVQSDTPNKKKKSGGLKLNLGLNGNKNKNTKEVNKEAAKSKPENKEPSNKKDKNDNKEHTESTGKKSKSKADKVNSKPDKNTSKQGKSSKQNKQNKPSEESKSHNQDHSHNQNTKPSKKTKTKKSSLKVNSEETKPVHDDSDSMHETNQNERPVVNPKRRRRHEQESNDSVRGINVEEKEVEVVEYIDNSDSLGFRNSEEEVQQEEQELVIEETKSKFEDLVWSEDKFPKK